MEYGFYHADRGYWQTTCRPCAEILASYPAGTVEVPLKPGAGYEWDGETWIAPPEPSVDDLRAHMPPISKRQLRLTLVRNGISLDSVAQAIAGIEGEQDRVETQIEWEDATEFERLHPRILMIADALGLTAEQIDTMWQEAIEA